MKKYVVAAVIAILVLVAGVAVYTSRGITSPNGTVALGNRSGNGSDVPFTKLASGINANVHAQANYVIDSQEKLNSLWNLLPGAGPMPTIDFEKNIVVALFAGEQPTTGYDLSVSGIEDSASARTVHVVLNKPAPSCLTGQIITQPYLVLEVSKTDLPLAHTDTETVTDCAQ